MGPGFQNEFMTDVRIKGAYKALPPYCRSTEEILPIVPGWLEGEPDRLIRKAVKIFEGAGVDYRYGIMDVGEVFTQTSFEDKNQTYIQEAKRLGGSVLRTALEPSGW